MPFSDRFKSPEATLRLSFFQEIRKLLDSEDPVSDLGKVDEKLLGRDNLVMLSAKIKKEITTSVEADKISGLFALANKLKMDFSDELRDSEPIGTKCVVNILSKIEFKGGFSEEILRYSSEALHTDVWRKEFVFDVLRVFDSGVSEKISDKFFDIYKREEDRSVGKYLNYILDNLDSNSLKDVKSFVVKLKDKEILQEAFGASITEYLLFANKSNKRKIDRSLAIDSI